jgi:hypothetical protein
MQTFESGYRYARFVVGVLNVFGTIVAIIGVVGLALSLMSIFRSMGDGATVSMAVFFVLGPSAALLLTGVVIIAFSELIRSQLDTADDMRQLLHSLRRPSTPGSTLF